MTIFSDGFFEKQITKKLMCFVCALFKYYLYTSLVTISANFHNHSFQVFSS
jgi:hypothetical protein